MTDETTNTAPETVVTQETAEPVEAPSVDSLSQGAEAIQDQPTTPGQSEEPSTEPAETTPSEPAEQPHEPASESAGDTVYGYKLPEGVPPEVAQFAKQNEMSQKQLDASIAYFGGVINSMKDSEKAEIAKAGHDHVKNWGERAEYNLNLARRALRQIDQEGAMTKFLNETGYGNHPVVIDFLYGIGESLKEGGFLKGSTRRPPGQKSPAQRMFPNMPSRDA